MASDISRGAVLLEEGQQFAQSVESSVWDSQILVLASDETRASLIAGGLSDKPLQVEVTGQADWEPRRLKLVGASAIILASAEADLELLSELLAMRRFRSIPILVFVDRSSREEMSQALKLGVSSFIVDGLEPERIPVILEVAEERHVLTSELRDELRKSQENLAARKTIERAKGLLMTKSGLPEQEVYDSMRRLAMTQGKTMREVAENILAIFALFP
nr:ANTAR domain-containing protein [uncultured Hyphomonas sp.]